MSENFENRPSDNTPEEEEERKKRGAIPFGESDSVGDTEEGAVVEDNASDNESRPVNSLGRRFAEEDDTASKGATAADDSTVVDSAATDTAETDTVATDATETDTVVTNKNVNETTTTTTTTTTGATAATVVEETTRNKRTIMWWIIGIIATILAILIILFFTVFRHSATPVADSAPSATPLAKGNYIIVPDNTDGGLSNSKRLQAAKASASATPKASASSSSKLSTATKTQTATGANGQKTDTQFGDTPKYEDPTSLDGYRTVLKDGTVVLKAPIDGPCSISETGAIVPPNNYMHVCYYTKNGAVFYTSHSVVGPRTGALENIQYLKVGQIVTLGGVDYVVSSVNVYLANALPAYLFKPGIIALVTCHLDASVKNYHDFTKTDVVILKKK